MLSFKEALESQPPILSDYRIITISVTKSQIAELIDKNIIVRHEKEDWDMEVETRMLASLIAVRKAMKNHPIRHAVSFHSSIKRAKVFKNSQDTFSSIFSEYGKLGTFHVSGNTSTGERARILRDFANCSFGLISNAQCLAEGVDIPDIDCILFADPRRSTVDIVQAVGRALRLSKNKECGYIIIPIIIDESIEKVDLNYNNDFTEVIRVLRALASNDDRIIEYFRAVSKGEKPSNGNLISIDSDEVLAKKIDLNEFINHVELICWKRLAKLSWRPFEEAREFVRGLGLETSNEWKSYCNGEFKNIPPKPDDIPVHPDRSYKLTGWINMGDWLGTGNVAMNRRNYRNFHEARQFARSLNLKNGSDWRDYCKGKLDYKSLKPFDIPANPNVVYKEDGWISMGDWLGTGNVDNRKKQFQDFYEARQFARSLNLKSGEEWKDYCKGKFQDKPSKPDDIPNAPRNIYKNQGWINMGDWLGTEFVATRTRKYRDFLKAREFTQSLNLKNLSDWKAYCKGEMPEKPPKPDDIPSNPNRTYKNQGWINAGDWLGTGSIAAQKKKFIPFKEARNFARSLKLSGIDEWYAYCRGELPDKPTKPDNIPSSPKHVYRNSGWAGTKDWLGK